MRSIQVGNLYFPVISGLIRRAAFGCAVGAISVVPYWAEAGQACIPASEAEAALIDWYGEAPVQDGPNNTVLWVSSDRSTWTVLKYTRDGFACRVDHGTDWTGDLVLTANEQTE